MSVAVPLNPAIYHITHLANLPGILRDGCLWSDAERLQRSLATTNIGYTHIKQRRLKRLVSVAAGGRLGDYVPFYFCNRSVMLYVISRGHVDYSGGQDEILHLVSSVATATKLKAPWAFTDRHAELGHALYFDSLTDLGEVDWSVMPLEWWSESETQERRQAEFLVHMSFPWSGIESIGVRNDAIASKVRAVVGADGPPVDVRQTWYY